jgi:gamma-glutamylputrescine oxidase
MLPATMPDASHMPSWYAASCTAPPPAPPLQGGAEADVAVIGGGLAGISGALHLAERGRRVVLLEEHRLGWGASGRNGGQALVGVACGQGKLERLLGDADARLVWQASVEAVGMMRERIARHAIDCDWVDGHMMVAEKPRHLAELEAARAEFERYGYHGTQLLDAAGTRALLATERYIGALLDPGSAHLHPLKYTLGLAAAARAAGVQVHEGTRAISFTRRAGQLVVRTPGGELRCDQLLLAGNTGLGPLAPALARKIIAIDTYIVATEPLGQQRATELVRNNAAVADLNWIIDYYRRSADHRLLFGGRVSYSGMKRFEAVPATRARMLRVYPQLEGVRIEHHWGGALDITVNRAPHFGRLERDVYFLQGFSGHGLALTGMAGRLAAEAMAGASERFEAFARIPHRDFPGGAFLRRPALVLAMLWYRMRDLLG